MFSKTNEIYFNSLESYECEPGIYWDQRYFVYLFLVKLLKPNMCQQSSDGDWH
jgi:hypothetical protein